METVFVSFKSLLIFFVTEKLISRNVGSVIHTSKSKWENLTIYQMIKF